MRILALYDIHGNSDALAAVLSDARAQDPDVVVVGGDAVPGPFAGEVLQQLAALRAPVRWVRGNGEREVAAAVGLERDVTDVVGASTAFSAKEIGPVRARALGALPLSITVDNILFCHASPRRDDEMLTRLTPVPDWEAALAGTEAELVVAGHTHQQDDRTVGTTRFLNAGSVGWPYEGDGRARWLWIENGQPDLRATSFDARTAGERARATGWPDMESIEAALIAPLPAIEITRAFEQIRVTSQTNKTANSRDLG